MKTLGTIVLIGAALIGGYALFAFDPSVATIDGGRVNNLGLMQDRQNLLIASCAGAVVGCILMVFGGHPGASSTSAHDARPDTRPRFSATEALDPNKLLALEDFRDALKRDDAIVVRKMLNDLTVRAYHELPTGRGFLQYAVTTNAVECIPLLLEGGARFDQRDSAGKTALDLVANAKREVQDLLPSSLAPAPSLNFLTAAPSDDDFAAALDECSSAFRRPGVWAKAFAEALGDDVRAKAIYTGRRAGELAAERAGRERAELQRLEEVRARLEREAYDAKPKGTCPNCDVIVPLDAETCVSASCGANFTAADGWRVKPLPA